MQDSPEKEILLSAIARFLDKDVRPLISDPRLSFRVLIAAHLAQVAALESAAEDGHDAAELARLRALFGDEQAPPPPDRAARTSAIASYNRRLAERIRGGLSPDERARVTAHVMATLRDKLAVNNVRFDATSMDLGEQP